DLDTAPLASHLHTSQCQNRVAEVADFRHLDVQVPKRMPLVPVLAHLLRAAERPLIALRLPHDRGEELDLRVSVSPKRVEVTAIPAVEASLYRLHVLLRHRLLLESRGCEG